MDCLEKISAKWWGMLLLSTIPFFIILGPVLFGGRIFFGGDLITILYPLYSFYQDSLTTGQSIFWNPDNFSGFPSFIGSMSFLSPVHWVLFQLLPLFTAYNLIVFLNVTLGLFFTWLLLKKFNLPSMAGFIGGLVYVFSQWFIVPNVCLSNILPLLPLLFLILWRIKEKNDNWSILFGSLLIGYGWLSVHFNWLVMTLSAGFLFAFWLAYQNKKWSLLFKFFLMTILGTLIGLLIIWPLFNYTGLSARAEGLSYKQVVDGALYLGDFVRLFLPYFWISVFNFTNSQTQLYLGIIPLFLAIFAFTLRDSLVRFFAFLFSVCLLMGIAYLPFFWLLHQLPIFESFRGPSRWMFIGSFAAAILTGFGLKYFLSQEKEKWRRRFLKIFKWLAGAILLLSVVFTLIFSLFKEKFISLAQNYFDRHLYGQTSGLPLEHYHKVIQGMFDQLEGALSILNPKVFLPIIFILVSYFVLAYFSKKKAAQNFLSIIALVILLNFLLVFGFYHSTISKEAFSRQPTTVKFLKEHPGRYFSFLPGFTEYSKLTIPHQPDSSELFIFQSELLPPNMNLFYGLESVDYYDNLMSRPMARVLALIGSDQATIGEKLADLSISPQEKIKKLEEQKKLLDFLGVRYIISAFSLDEERFPKVFETKVPPYDIPIAIYENSGARPLFYLADQGEIVLAEKENSFARLIVESASPQWLVFSENYLPGWQAYIDDKETAIHQVNGLYMGIHIPPGEHNILFKYNPYKL